MDQQKHTTEDTLTDIFGSKEMRSPAPTEFIPKNKTAPEIAYQLVKDETYPQTQPRLNLATFVTTYMDDYATRLMNEAININYIDETEYPRVDIIEVDGLVHQTRGVVVQIGGHERRQVQPRLGLGIGLVLDQLIGDFGCGLVLGDEFRGSRRAHLFRAENVGQRVFGGVFLLIHNVKIFIWFTSDRSCMNYAINLLPLRGETTSYYEKTCCLYRRRRQRRQRFGDLP